MKESESSEQSVEAAKLRPDLEIYLLQMYLLQQRWKEGTEIARRIGKSGSLADRQIAAGFWCSFGEACKGMGQRLKAEMAYAEAAAVWPEGMVECDADRDYPERHHSLHGELQRRVKHG